MEAVVEQTALTDYEIEPQRRTGGKPRPSKNHSKLQIRLEAELFIQYAEQYDIRSEQLLGAPNPPFVLDLSIFPAEASNWLQDEVKEKAVPLTVIEIVSPSQADTELTGKAKDYSAAGTKSYWLVQPLFRTVVVLQPNADELVFHNDLLTEPTNGISIDLKKVFR